MSTTIAAGLDALGTADPTGLVDGYHALTYVARGEWGNAGLTALAVIPIVGDAFKLAKYGRAVGGVEDVVSVPSSAGRPSVFYVNPAGEAISSSTLARQGTSHLAGNFNGLAGRSVDDIVSRVPAGWTSAPQRAGNGLRFFDEAGFERLRLHGPNANAPANSNSAVGWTLRIQSRAINPRNILYYDDAGRIVSRTANEGHIPIYGNPNAGR